MSDTYLNYPGLQEYDQLIKQYIDDKFFFVPISSATTTTVKWNELYEAYSNNVNIIAKIDYVESGVTIPVTVPLYLLLGSQSGGSVMFTFVMGQDLISYIVTGSGSSTCVITKQVKEAEITLNKSQSVIADTGSTIKYPSVKAVEDFVKPVVIWEETTPANYLIGLQTDLTASPAWQLTGLDMTPYKRIKIYSCAGRGTGIAANASTTAAMILEMSLDPRAAISDYGGNYVGSVINQKPNDANRLATLTCAVSADKTSFAVLRQTNLYGTGATSNNDVNANVFLIEGYYY